MKKIVMCLIAMCFCCGTAWAGGDQENDVKVKKIFDAVTLNNSSVNSNIMSQNSSGRGYRTISYRFDTVATSTTAKIKLEYYVSPTQYAVDFSKSSDGYLILNDVHEGSGTDVNGVDTVRFEPVISGYYYFKLTETETQAAKLTVWLTSQ